MTYGTSYHALVQRAQLAVGETLLVHGATGGVGTAAVEIGKLLGARVIATAGSDEKLQTLQKLYGVEHVINYRTNTAWRERVKELTSGDGADVIYDPVGGDVFEQSLRCINWKGRLLVVGFAGGPIPSAKANLILLKGCSVVACSGALSPPASPTSTARTRAAHDLVRAGVRSSRRSRTASRSSARPTP